MSEFILKASQIINGHQYLFIDSSLRSSGTAENFIFDLPYLITNVKSIQPIYTIFPNNIYTVSTLNNQLDVIINGILRSVYVTPGTYNISSLVTELNDLSLDLKLVFFYDPLTLKISITNTDSIPFQISATSTITSVLGFTPQYNYNDIVVSHVSNGVVKINNTYDYIHITTDLVQQYYGTQLRNYMATVPISSIQSGTVSQIMFPGVQYTASKSFFQSVSVQLVDKAFNQIDNNNSDFIFAIRLEFF